MTLGGPTVGSQEGVFLMSEVPLYSVAPGPTAYHRILRTWETRNRLSSSRIRDGPASRRGVPGVSGLKSAERATRLYEAFFLFFVTLRKDLERPLSLFKSDQQIPLLCPLWLAASLNPKRTHICIYIDIYVYAYRYICIYVCIKYINRCVYI